MENPNLLDRAFKLKFGLKFCLLTIAGMLALTLFIFLMTSRELGGSYGKAIYTIYNLKINIFSLIFSSFYSILILLAVSISIAFITLLFSHKIAGPIYRIEKNLEVIGAGDLTKNTTLRGHDQLTGLAEDINSLVRSLNHKVRICGEAASRIKACEERIAYLIKSKNPSEEDLSDALKALKTGIEELKKATSDIKV